MTAIDLNTLLQLVGTLNDSTDETSASSRFRSYLSENVEQSADLDAYISVALQNSGDQYNKALQDLINHLGHLLGFEVEFGRYRGVRGDVGFDGLWKSSTGWSVVVETKTTDTYTVRTDTLLGYINRLVSDGRVASSDQSVGLYVYGRFDSRTSQLENAITVEKRRDQLRVISVPALVGLLELKQEYGLSHEAILGLLRPAPIRIDHIVDLIIDVVAQEQEKDPIVTPAVESGVKTGSITPDPADPATVPPPMEVIHPSVRSAENFTGRRLISITLFGKRNEVTKWILAMEFVLQSLLDRDRAGFLAIAPTLAGRRRPYFTSDKSLLRVPGSISGTDLYFETNLSAQQIAKVCWLLLEQMGYQKGDLIFEVV